MPFLDTNFWQVIQAIEAQQRPLAAFTEAMNRHIDSQVQQPANSIQALNHAYSLNVQTVYTHFQTLFPELEPDPDVHEVFEHPETERMLPETRTHLIEFAPTLRLIKEIRMSRRSLHDLTWRQPEEMVAELLRQEGYDVQLGPGSKDDGVDLLVTRHDPLMGFYIAVWQAKKLMQGNKVGIGVIRELADTRDQFHATKGVIVTTTSFTSVALQRVERDHQITIAMMLS